MCSTGPNTCKHWYCIMRLSSDSRPSGDVPVVDAQSHGGRTPHYGGLAEQDLLVRLGFRLGVAFSGIRLAPRGNHGPVAAIILLPVRLVGPRGFDVEMDLVASRLDGRDCAQAARPMAQERSHSDEMGVVRHFQRLVPVIGHRGEHIGGPRVGIGAGDARSHIPCRESHGAVILRESRDEVQIVRCIAHRDIGIEIVALGAGAGDRDVDRLDRVECVLIKRLVLGE